MRSPDGKTWPEMERAPHKRWQLVADLGGTHLRFGLVEGRDSVPRHVVRYRADDFPTARSAVSTYLALLKPEQRPARACFAVAAPVEDGMVRWTNRDWELSVQAMASEHGFDQVVLINDYAAAALSLPGLSPDLRRPIGGGRERSGSALAVLGTGTGLGMAILAQGRGSFHVLESEGGHALLAPVDELEQELVSYLLRQASPVSWERVLSGPGLERLYHFCAQRAGRPGEALTSRQISARALRGACADCRLAMDMFYRLLGSVSADLALTAGARGGIFLAGTMLNELGPDLASSGFRQRFEDREGRYRRYMAEIPTYLLTLKEPGLYGAARYLLMDPTERPASVLGA